MWLLVVVAAGLYFLLQWIRSKRVLSTLTDKSVLITGCDSGFGNLLARQLDCRGLHVLAACFTPQGAEKLKQHTSQRLQTIILDVCSPESVARATEWVKSQVGDKGLWGLVNNAGISVPTASNDWLTKEDFRKILDVNFLGLVDVTLHMLPLLRKARGRVVNVASIMGRIAPFGGGYCPSKYAVEAFSDSLRRENVVFGVKVCIIEPGFFKTAITNEKTICENVKVLWERLPDETKGMYGESFLQETLQSLRMLLALCNSNLTLVTDAIEHALTAVHPRSRYSTGWDARFFFIPLSYLPTWLADMVLTWSRPKQVQS